jgi:hypothetical protein
VLEGVAAGEAERGLDLVVEELEKKRGGVSGEEAGHPAAVSISILEEGRVEDDEDLRNLTEIAGS